MSLGYFTSNTLIADVKRRAMIPSNQNTFKTTDFLELANSELKMGLLPSILQLHEEFYVFPESVPVVANKQKYSIPYRAIGGKLRDIFYRDTNGNLFEMSRISPEDKAAFQYNTANGNYLYYYLEGNSVVLASKVSDSVSGSFIFTYFIRPSDLVEESRVGIVQSVTADASTTTYTLDKIPTGFSASTKFDLLQAKPGHKIRNIDLLPVSVNATNKTITFNTIDVDNEMESGDVVAFAGECIIPQCPSDLHPVLAQRVAARCLEALGDTQGLTNANAKIQEMEMKTVPLIDSRVDGAPKKLLNRRGLLNNKFRRW